MDYQTQNHVTVEYERTIEDIIEFNLFHMSHSPSIRRRTLTTQIIVALFVFIVGLAIGYIFSPETRVLTIFDYVAALIGSVTSFSVVPYLNRLEVIRGLRKASSEGDNSAILGHQTITLTPENISIKTQGAESKFNWSSIEF